jgi:hypothetical protein
MIVASSEASVADRAIERLVSIVRAMRQVAIQPGPRLARAGGRGVRAWRRHGSPDIAAEAGAGT